MTTTHPFHFKFGRLVAEEPSVDYKVKCYGCGDLNPYPNPPRIISTALAICLLIIVIIRNPGDDEFSNHNKITDTCFVNLQIKPLSAYSFITMAGTDRHIMNGQNIVNGCYKLTAYN